MTTDSTQSTDELKVGLVMTTYSPDPTGQHARMNDVLRYVRRNSSVNISFEVFVLSWKGQKEASDAYTIHYQEGGKVIRAVTSLSGLLKCRSDLDLVHLIAFPTWVGFPLELVNIGKPLVVGPNIGGRMFPWSSFDEPTREVVKAEKPGLLRRWRWYGELIERFKLRFARSRLYPSVRFLAFSEWVQDEVLARRGVPTDDVTVLPSGVPTDIFRPGAQQVRDEERLKLLFVGKPTRRKGMRLLAEAIADLDQRGIRVDVLVAGTDNPPEWLSNLAVTEDRFEFLGRVPRAELPTYYNAVDAYVCPSYYEMESTTMIEALACGTPCIATDGRAFREVCDGNGIFFDRGDADSLAETILEFRQEKDDWHKRAMAQSDRYDIEQTFETIMDTYAAIAGR